MRFTKKSKQKIFQKFQNFSRSDFHRSYYIEIAVDDLEFSKILWYTEKPKNPVATSAITEFIVKNRKSGGEFPIYPIVSV